MTTLLTRDPAVAARALADRQLVSIPTETVYGLAADARSEAAVARVFEAKGRPSDNPLIVHLADAALADEVGAVSPLAARLLEAFAPGPLTLVLPSRGVLPRAVTAGLETVAVRIPALPLTREILTRAEVPVVAPSANRSGRPSPTTWTAVRDDLDGRIDVIVQGPPCRIGIESTVVDATGTSAVLLRPGAVSLDAIREIDPSARLRTATDDLARSPGLRHRHYAPSARVRLIATVRDAAPHPSAAFIGLATPDRVADYAFATVCPSTEVLAKRLFDAFRRADAEGLERIDVQGVPEIGIGVAVMDRVRRAAEDR